MVRTSVILTWNIILGTYIFVDICIHGNNSNLNITINGWFFCSQIISFYQCFHEEIWFYCLINLQEICQILFNTPVLCVHVRACVCMRYGENPSSSIIFCFKMTFLIFIMFTRLAGILYTEIWSQIVVFIFLQYIIPIMVFELHSLK